MKVTIGDGTHMQAEGKVKDITMNVQDNVSHLPMYLLSLSRAELILGGSQLATLGDHLANYETAKLMFYKDGHLLTLHGETLAAPQQAELHHIQRMHMTKAITKCYVIQCAQAHCFKDIWLDLPVTIEVDLALLLNNYSMVFNKPVELPPPYSHDHSIPLEKDVGLIKV